MIEPWFSTGAAHWLAYFSLFAVVGVLEMFVRQGRFRQQVTLAYGLCALLGAALVFAGAIGWTGRQPHYVTMPLLGAGTIMTLAFGYALTQLNRQYTDAELRRIAASDI